MSRSCRFRTMLMRNRSEESTYVDHKTHASLSERAYVAERALQEQLSCVLLRWPLAVPLRRDEAHDQPLHLSFPRQL